MKGRRKNNTTAITHALIEFRKKRGGGGGDHSPLFFCSQRGGPVPVASVSLSTAGLSNALTGVKD